MATPADAEDRLLTVWEYLDSAVGPMAALQDRGLSRDTAAMLIVMSAMGQQLAEIQEQLRYLVEHTD